MILLIAEQLGWMTFEGSFPHKLFYDSMILCFPRVRDQVQDLLQLVTQPISNSILWASRDVRAVSVN